MLFRSSPLTPLTSPMLLLRVTLLLMLLLLLEPIHCSYCWCFFDPHLSPLTSSMQLLLLCLPLLAILLMLLLQLIYYCCCVLYSATQYASAVAGNFTNARKTYPLLDTWCCCGFCSAVAEVTRFLIVSVEMFIASLSSQQQLQLFKWEWWLHFVKTMQWSSVAIIISIAFLLCKDCNNHIESGLCSTMLILICGDKTIILSSESATAQFWLWWQLSAAGPSE